MRFAKVDFITMDSLFVKLYRCLVVRKENLELTGSWMLSFLSTSSQSASLDTALLWNALEPAGGKAGPAGKAVPCKNATT